ncbi:MAG: lactate utilization protein [Bacteroidales bacterium]|jgi:L-lactate dehydrogenase complex protein LldF|nr:lactate utilization protein [Bacteroidales bacterium]
MSTKHSIAAEKFNQDSGRVTRHDQTFWSVRSKRDGLAYQLEEWEQLRESANLIKRHTITHLADYLEQFEANAKKNGVHVHWAKDADEYNDIVMQIMREHNVKKVVKSKSMLTEECHLNDNLIKHGIDVVETDLGERILQLMEIPPSHIVMPAIHVTREEVAACFREKGIIEQHGARAAEGLLKEGDDWHTSSDPTYLTRAARYHLRDNFMHADCGMTGGNFGIAETGDIVVCTNEGNADMSTSIPKLHIVSIGLEKIIPNYKAMGVFQRLLARHGTGQATTVYTSHFRKARPGAEMHIILVDNGRSSILGNAEHWQTLKCMRCGACMNTCPVYRRSGGYSYTYFIPGPIGINLGMLKDRDANYHNCSACSLCMSCDNVCPVKVDLSTQIYKWRQELDTLGHADGMKKMTSAGMQTLFEHPSLYTTALKFAPLANHVPAFMTNIKANAWCYGHTMPEFAKQSFHTLWKKGKVK